MAKIEKVHSRTIATKEISMWGTLHVNRPGGTVAGWLVDSWTEKGIEPHLHPRMNWVAKDDGKLYRVYLMVGPPGNSISIDAEDIDIEPAGGAPFPRKHLAYAFTGAALFAF
jgi:hypothetical protein